MTEQLQEASVCLFQYEDELRVLCLVDGGDDPDFFLKTADGALMRFDSIAAMQGDVGLNQRYAIRYGDGLATFDLKAFFRLVNGLRQGKASYTKACDCMLNMFNIFEDLAYSLGLGYEGYFKDDSVMARILEKLFWGCGAGMLVSDRDVPYHPYWLRAEAKYVRQMAKQMWSGILKAAPEVFGKTD